MAAPVLTGPRITLRPLRPTDVEARRAHGFHAEIERNYGSERGDGPMSPEEALAWHDSALAAGDTFWLVEVGGAVAGAAFLHSVREVDSKAHFAIGMFAPQFMGKGVGTEATGLVLDHAFGDLGLHRVTLRVLSFNAAAIACYERSGFLVEGRERESCHMGERWYDDVIMGIVVSDPRPSVVGPAG
ncbi:GNAT family N-acetyltransferase [Oryzobacter telluris]|uniref:GNAT family N-acetyltransferase n=1 Tax=Oryzobacter telluris TaxID=3149179 RepID=UPI00370DB58F